MSAKDKVIKSSKYPVPARLIMEAIYKLEGGDRLGGHKRVATALNRISPKKIVAQLDKSIEEAGYLVMGDDYDTLQDKSLQQSVKTYFSPMNGTGEVVCQA